MSDKKPKHRRAVRILALCAGAVLLLCGAGFSSSAAGHADSSANAMSMAVSSVTAGERRGLSPPSSDRRGMRSWPRRLAGLAHYDAVPVPAREGDPATA